MARRALRWLATAGSLKRGVLKRDTRFELVLGSRVQDMRISVNQEPTSVVRRASNLGNNLSLYFHLYASKPCRDFDIFVQQGWSSLYNTLPLNLFDML